jgi:hypothetical protein
MELGAISFLLFGFCYVVEDVNDDLLEATFVVLDDFLVEYFK